MKLDLIQTGMKYKYQQLCEAFDLKPATGNTKKKHMTTFEQYLKLEKQGTWFLVVEKYGEVKEREDKRKDNGKNEASQKALAESDKGRKSFFKEDELQLAILWTLGSRYYEQRLTDDSSIIYIPKNKMHVHLGLCNEFFNTLFRNIYHYSKLNKNDERETAYDLWKVQVAFNSSTSREYHDNIDYEMQRHVITAFNQLQRKKVLEYSYWKAWSDGTKETLFTDEQMKLFLTMREQNLDWWNETHKNRVCKTVGEIYDTLTPKEVNEFETELKFNLSNTKEFRGLKYYFSCYKTFFSISAIKRELNKRGFNTGITMEDFNNAFIENMAETVERINDKFIQRQVERINKLREKQINDMQQYEEEIAKFYEYVEQHRERGFGKRSVKEPKMPKHGLTEYEDYQEVLEILYLGLKLIEDLTAEQSGMMQGIEHCIEVNKKQD